MDHWDYQHTVQVDRFHWDRLTQLLQVPHTQLAQVRLTQVLQVRLTQVLQARHTVHSVALLLHLHCLLQVKIRFFSTIMI